MLHQVLFLLTETRKNNSFSQATFELNSFKKIN